MADVARFSPLCFDAVAKCFHLGCMGESGVRPTIHDVSRLAGVSIKTVSRVLNNEPRVSEATRARVTAAFATLKYRPNMAARTLAGHRSFQIALACDNPSPYYVYEMQSGIRDRCLLDGVRMIAQPYDHDSDRLIDDIESLIDGSSVDGLILTPPATDYPEVLALMARRKMRFVRVSPGTDLDLTASVFIDNVGAATVMTRHLLALGHRRIGFIAGHADYATSAQRLAGYRAALDEADVAFDPVLVRPGDYDFASGRERPRRCWRFACRPPRSSPRTTTWRRVRSASRIGAGCRCRPTCRSRASATMRSRGSSGPR